MQVGVVDPLLQVGEHGLVLLDVVDHGDHDAEGILVWRQLNVGSGELHEDQDLVGVAHDARLTHREHVGSEGRNGETERDGPLELVLHHQLGLQLVPHQLNNVLQSF